MKTPMLYVFIFIFLFSIGGFTGIMLGALSVDIHLHDTYYVVAHFHYVMMGGTLIALLAGLHYWWPKMTGKMYNEPLAKIAAGFIFIGFNVTFLPQFIMGAQGMPRRYYNYIDQFTPFHQTSTIGSYILALGFLIILYYLAHSLFKGKKSGTKSMELTWTRMAKYFSPGFPQLFSYAGGYPRSLRLPPANGRVSAWTSR